MHRYNVAELLRAAPGTSERHEISDLRLPLADGLELARPIDGHVKLTNSGRGILVQGHLDAGLQQRCSRCLRDAASAISLELEDEALPSMDLATGLPLALDAEPDVLRVDGHHELDLEPVIRDAISLAEPIAPLCQPDCPGLCETCGADLATEPGHGHPADDLDPRLAAMAGLREHLS